MAKYNQKSLFSTLSPTVPTVSKCKRRVITFTKMLWLGDVTCWWKLLWLLVNAGSPLQNPDRSDADRSVSDSRSRIMCKSTHTYGISFTSFTLWRLVFRVVQKPTVLKKKKKLKAFRVFVRSVYDILHTPTAFWPPPEMRDSVLGDLPDPD